MIYMIFDKIGPKKFKKSQQIHAVKMIKTKYISLLYPVPLMPIINIIIGHT